MEKHEYIESILDQIEIKIGSGRNTLGTVLGKEISQDLRQIGRLVEDYKEDISRLDSDQRIALVAKMVDVLIRPEENRKSGRLLTLEAECFETLNSHSSAQLREDLAILRGRGRYAEAVSSIEAEVATVNPAKVNYRLGSNEPTVYA